MAQVVRFGSGRAQTSTASVEKTMKLVSKHKNVPIFSNRRNRAPSKIFDGDSLKKFSVDAYFATKLGALIEKMVAEVMASFNFGNLHG